MKPAAEKNTSQSYLMLLLDEDEDDFVLLQSLLQAAFGEAVTLDWYQRDHVTAEIVCNVPYAITFIEYRLGHESGLDIIKNVKTRCPERVLFLCTDWENTSLGEEARQAGADGFIPKGGLTPELLKRVLAPYLPGL